MRTALINDVQQGVLKMLDIECMIKAQRVICLKTYIDDYFFILFYFIYSPRHTIIESYSQ